VGLKVLVEGAVLGVVDLGEGLLDDGKILVVGGAEEILEAEGGLAEEDFGVAEVLVVGGEGEIDLLGELLDSSERGEGAGGVAGGVLAEAKLSHLADELGVEETLLAGLGVASAGDEVLEALLGGRGVLGGAETRGGCGCDEEEGNCQRNLEPHEEASTG
jgi:hypothetical protein